MENSKINTANGMISKGGNQRMQLLFVGNNPSNNLHDFQNEVVSTFVTPIEALDKISGNQISIDAIIVDATIDFLEIDALRKIAGRRESPFILYTPTFEQRIKDMAKKVGADDYFYGSKVYSLASRIRLTIRLREYKVQWIKHETWKHFQKRIVDAVVASILLTLFLPITFIVAIDLEIECMEDHVFSNTKEGKWNKIYNYYQYIALILLSPLFVIIAIPFRIGSLKEHFFSTSKKVGFGNRVFDMYRFKTEVVKRNDPSNTRSTQLGMLLIKTGLVDLPQLVNVLKGDMSLIGSKPLGTSEAAKLPKNQSVKQFITQPGLTGLRHAH